MSRRETPMTRWYWSQTGGLLIEKFQVVASTPLNGRRLIDGLIVQGEPTRHAPIGFKFDIRGRDAIAIQAKNSRLGMYLMGQTLFSAQLLHRLGARSVRSVALCALTDCILQPMLEAYPGCNVVVCPQNVCREITSRSSEPPGLGLR